MNLTDITIYSLIGVGVLLCICAFVWTKFIRPNSFAYSNKNVFIKHQYNELITKLRTTSKVWCYENIYLDFDNNKNKPIVIERLFVTIQGIYIVTNEIEKNVNHVRMINNEIKLIKKTKIKDLPLDVNLNIANAKLLKNKFSNVPIKIIVPMANDSFNVFSYQNTIFVNQKKMFEKIVEVEDESSNFNATEFVENFDKIIIKQKPKRTFMNIKWKNKEM